MAGPTRGRIQARPDLETVDHDWIGGVPLTVFNHDHVVGPASNPMDTAGAPELYSSAAIAVLAAATLATASVLGSCAGRSVQQGSALNQTRYAIVFGPAWVIVQAGYYPKTFRRGLNARMFRIEQIVRATAGASNGGCFPWLIAIT